MAVPPILLSGHHGEVAKWRGEQAVERTRRERPDLLKDPSGDADEAERVGEGPPSGPPVTLRVGSGGLRRRSCSSPPPGRRLAPAARTGRVLPDRRAPAVALLYSATVPGARP